MIIAKNKLFLKGLQKNNAQDKEFFSITICALSGAKGMTVIIL